MRGRSWYQSDLLGKGFSCSCCSWLWRRRGRATPRNERGRRWKLGRARKLLPRPQRGTQPHGPHPGFGRVRPVSDFWPAELLSALDCASPSSSWSFITAAVEHSCRRLWTCQHYDVSCGGSGMCRLSALGLLPYFWSILSCRLSFRLHRNPPAPPPATAGPSHFRTFLVLMPCCS